MHTFRDPVRVPGSPDPGGAGTGASTEGIGWDLRKARIRESP